MKHLRTANARRGARGSVLIAALALVATLGLLAFALTAATVAQQRAARELECRERAFHAAEAALSEAWLDLLHGGDGNVANESDPLRVGGVECWVLARPAGADRTELVATARAGTLRAHHQLLVEDRSGEVEDFGVLGYERVVLRSGSLVDSYDSSAGRYESQVRSDHARENGNVGSNGDIRLSSKARVYGFAQHGPDEDDSIALAPDVTLWDGFGAALDEIPSPTIAVPSFLDAGPLVVERRRRETIGPGEVQLAKLVAKEQAEVVIEGPCELVVTGDVLVRSAASLTFDARRGAIRVYARAGFQLQPRSRLTTLADAPASVALYLLGEHSEPDDRSPAIALEADGRLEGTLLAPHLSVALRSCEVLGRVSARWVDLGSGARVHYDERLAASALDPVERLGVVAWRVVGDRGDGP